MRRLGYLSLQERIWGPGTKAKVEWLFPGAPHQKLMLLVLTSLKGLHKMTFAWVVQANDNDCHIPGRGKEKLLKGTNLLMLRLRILFFLHVWSLVCNSLNSCIIKSPTTVAGVVWLPLPNPPRMHAPPPPPRHLLFLEWSSSLNSIPSLALAVWLLPRCVVAICPL